MVGGVRHYLHLFPSHFCLHPCQSGSCHHHSTEIVISWSQMVSISLSPKVIYQPSSEFSDFDTAKILDSCNLLSLRVPPTSLSPLQSQSSLYLTIKCRCASSRGPECLFFSQDPSVFTLLSIGGLLWWKGLMLKWLMLKQRVRHQASNKCKAGLQSWEFTVSQRHGQVKLSCTQAGGSSAMGSNNLGMDSWNTRCVRLF